MSRLPNPSATRRTTSSSRLLSRQERLASRTIGRRADAYLGQSNTSGLATTRSLCLFFLQISIGVRVDGLRKLRLNLGRFSAIPQYARSPLRRDSILALAVAHTSGTRAAGWMTAVLPLMLLSSGDSAEQLLLELLLELGLLMQIALPGSGSLG
jgi:hypothetical protein